MTLISGVVRSPIRGLTSNKGVGAFAFTYGGQPFTFNGVTFTYGSTS